MENIYTVASASSSTTFGNVMTFFKEQITQAFPAGYFKDVNLSSEIAYVNVRRRLKRNTLNEMSKLERPYMVIQPQIQPPSGDMYLYDIPLTKNFDNMEYGIQKNTLFPMIKNPDDGYFLNYKMNRDQIQFEVTITVDTLIQQLDLYKYMTNHFVWERPFTIKNDIEAMIPREIIRQVGVLSNIDIDSKSNNQIPAMIKHLNKYSSYNITYKMRNGTSLDEFFMYYNTEILVTFNDLNIDQVSRKNMTDDYYTITFRGTAEFNSPGVFVLTGSKPRPKAVYVSLDVLEKDSSHTMIPLYTINNFWARYKSIENGFLMYTSSRFQTERQPDGTDILDLSVLFDDAKLNVIFEYNANNIPMETLVSIKLIKDGKEMKDGEYKVKWNNLNLIVNDADDSATYCVLIYINNNLFNEHYANTVEDSSKDKKGL